MEIEWKSLGTKAGCLEMRFVNLESLSVVGW